MRLFAFTPRRTSCSPPSGFLPARYLALASGKPITGFQYYFPAQPFIHRAYALRYVLLPFQGFCSVQSSLYSCLPVC